MNVIIIFIENILSGDKGGRKENYIKNTKRRGSKD